MAFYLNNAMLPVKVKDEGGKIVKLKGLRIQLDGSELGRRQSQHRRASDKIRCITGARIEFSTEQEKEMFVRFVQKVQERMIDIETEPPI
jgi:hypothetical protein